MHFVRFPIPMRSNRHRNRYSALRSMLLALACVLLLCAVGVPSPLFAQENAYRYDDLTGHLADSQAAELLSNGETFASRTRDPITSLAPAAIAPRAQEIPKDSESERALIAEGLFFMPLAPADALRITALMLYNLMRLVSTLEGIEYYSTISNSRVPLYISSYVIDDPVTKNRQDDPIVSDIPTVDTQYIRQRDSNFGENTYRSRYVHRDALTSVHVTNIATLRYLIFPIVKKEDLNVFIAPLPTERGMLFYTMFFVESRSLIGFENKVITGLNNRMQAISGWFGVQLTEQLQ